MTKPSEIFDTPEATGFSRVGGNEEDTIVNLVQHSLGMQSKFLGKKSWIEYIIRTSIKEATTTKDQEKEEAIRKGWKGYVVVDPKADNYKYSPVFSTVEGAKIWLRGKGLNGLEIVEVDVLLALPIEDNN